MASNLLTFFMEFIGTFIFIYIVLKYQEPIPCGLAFTGLLYFNRITNGTYNPASSIAKYLNQELDTEKFIWFICGQVLGAFGAYYLYRNLNED
jgi:glycerol uptake facilitator-like aquaporin